MLFDLRGRGRRRTVRVIYIGLALLIGVGLVGFGVGGGFGGGGLLNAAEQQRRLQRRELRQHRSRSTRSSPSKQPNDARLGTADATPSSTKRRRSLRHAARRADEQGQGTVRRSRRRLEQLHRAEPDQAERRTGPARWSRVFGEEGLNEPAEAVQALQIVVAAEHGARRSTATLYAELAEYAYKANNTNAGDLAAAKARRASRRPHSARG